MDKELLKQIDRLIDEVKANLIQDITQLIELKNISETSSTLTPCVSSIVPTLINMGENEGFYTQDYPVGIASLALKDGQPDLGIWCPCVDKHLSALCGFFHFLKIFKELNVPLNYNPALYVSSTQQKGMCDLSGVSERMNDQAFYRDCALPRLSLVADGTFPVGYGGNGALSITFRGKRVLHGLKIVAGQPCSLGKAVATFYGKSIIVHSPVRPAWDPDPNGNMITQLMENLLSRKETALEDHSILEFFKLISKDVYGKWIGIDTDNEEIGPLTVQAQKLDTVGGYPDLTVQIHYPPEITFGEIVRMVTATAEKYDVAVIDACNIAKPYLLDKDQPVIRKLTSLANEVCGKELESCTLRKYTYANLLPNALVYGMDIDTKPDGCHNDHQAIEDVSFSVEQLLKGMKIYARALLALNEMEWEQMIESR